MKFSSHIIEKPITKNYEDWWRSPVESSAGFLYEGDKIVTHGDYIRNYYETIKKMIMKAGYEINDEKQLKGEIATLIYNLSDDHV